jgi:hypothetical protein
MQQTKMLFWWEESKNQQWKAIANIYELHFRKNVFKEGGNAHFKFSDAQLLQYVVQNFPIKLKRKLLKWAAGKMCQSQKMTTCSEIQASFATRWLSGTYAMNPKNSHKCFFQIWSKIW